MTTEPPKVALRSRVLDGQVVIVETVDDPEPGRLGELLRATADTVERIRASSVCAAIDEVHVTYNVETGWQAIVTTAATDFDVGPCNRSTDPPYGGIMRAWKVPQRSRAPASSSGSSRRVLTGIDPADRRSLAEQAVEGVHG